MKIRNKQTGEVKDVSSAELPKFGITASVKPQASPAPSSGIPNIKQGDFQSPLPGGSTPTPLKTNPIVEFLDAIGAGGFPGGAGGGMTTASFVKDLLTNPQNANSNFFKNTKENTMIPSSIRKTIDSGNKTNIAKKGTQELLNGAAYVANPASAGIKTRLATNAGIGGANAALDEHTDPKHIATAAILSLLTPEIIRGVENVGHEGIPKLLNDLVEHTAAKTKTAFPVNDLYAQLENRVPKAEGNIKNMLDVVDTMKTEAGVKQPGTKIYSGKTMNDKRKLFNKAYTGNTNLDKAQNTMAEILREHQVADNPNLAKLLPIQKFLTYDLPELLQSVPIAGRFGKKAVNMTTGAVSHAIPSSSSTIGELLQNIGRVGAQNTSATLAR